MKKIKTEYLVVGGIGVAAIAYAVLNKSKAVEVVNQDTAPVAQIPQTTPQPTVIKLNNNLVLKKGVTGNEVKQLQTLLGIAADGIFGTQTEASLKAKKGVVQITLGTYATTASVNNGALPVGTRVMANVRAGVRVLTAQRLANNTYSPGAYATTFDFGNEIGAIVSVSSPAKTSYVVKYSGWFTAWVDTYYWVNAADVVKI